jgi:hypothetical protein
MIKDRLDEYDVKLKAATDWLGIGYRDPFLEHDNKSSGSIKEDIS